MGRYSGILHKLADAAVSSGNKHSSHWNQVMNYLEGHSIGDANAENPKFDSPLPPFTGPSPELERELVDGQGPKREDTPLRIAVKNAPSHVMAALCHLSPEAARMADHRGRLPLHWACRFRSSDRESEKVFRILVLAYPEGLVHRDDGGRTPLHYLFWFHAGTRSAKTVELFCRTLPLEAFVGLKQAPPTPSPEAPPQLPEIPSPHNNKNIPANAAIVHDAKHGALPLHYAVMEGASPETVKALSDMYPQAKALTDRYGRTPLHWYLGSGTLFSERSSSHISGEPPDPNAPLPFEKQLSTSTVQILLSSKVARTVDQHCGRNPLHWAAHLLARHFFHMELTSGTIPECLSLQAVQFIVDHHVDALMEQDDNGWTPLHLLFQVVAQQQDLEWARLCRNKIIRDRLNLIDGGGVPGRFAPPVALVELLLQPPGVAPNSSVVHHPGERPICAAHVEDHMGQLPVHCAFRVASDAKVAKALIQSHPTCLLHTTNEEQLQTPLHAALDSPYATPLQTVKNIHILLQAYVTSRHGTFVDGRLALKMEDANGKYPLHYACENMAALEVIRLLFEKYPKSCTFQNSNGDLAVQSLLDPDLFGSVDDTTSLSQRATLATPMGWTSDVEESFRTKQSIVFALKIELLLSPIFSDEECLRIASFHHGMLPLHVAVAFGALDYAQLYRMISSYPAAIHTMTTVEGHAYSPLDLHEMRHLAAAATDVESWHMVRELLFSFGPTLESHRRKEDLLDRCVRIIRDELEGNGSVHATALEKIERLKPPEIMISETFSSVQPPQIDLAVRQTTPKATTPQNKFSTKKRKAKSFRKNSPSESSKQNPPIKSIYDDNDLGYAVSPEASFDDDDDFFSDGEEEEEEYYSDDYDSRYDDDSLFDNEAANGPRDEESNEKAQPVQEVVRTQNLQISTTCDESEANEKPEDGTASLTTQERSPSTQSGSLKKPMLCEVAQRIWFFFALYENPSCLDDHSAKQIEAILDMLEFPTVEWLLSLPLPEYAAVYLEDNVDIHSVRVQDVANAHCKAVFHRAFHFVGRYEFRPSPSETLLVHQSNDGDTVTVRAIEYLLHTEELNGFEPIQGSAEELIWTTGERQDTPPSKAKAALRCTTRKVCFKFMRNPKAYESEVECRKALGIPIEDGGDSTSSIVPLINHFNALAEDKRSSDKRYEHDIHDERFRTLHFLAQIDRDREDDENCLQLPDYPYAIVMLYRDDGDLHDYFFHHKNLKMNRISEISSQIGNSLRSIHERGLLHGSVTFRNVKLLESTGHASEKKCWALSDLSCASRQESNMYLAGISSNGTAQFSTGVFPPEMFVKLDPAELAVYTKYWDQVEALHNVTVDKAIVSPQFDTVTGDAYVLRCHFLSNDTQDTSLPALPYKLFPAREAGDIWAFGQLLFTLCSSGRPLSPCNMRTGHLLDYGQLCNWDHEKAEAIIFENVNDPLAQDILLHILSPYEHRAELNMDTVMSHPFLLADKTAKLTEKIIEQRTTESISYRRMQEQRFIKRAHEEWLMARTTTLSCWDLDFQMRMNVAPSELIKREFAGAQLPQIPYSFVILPYRLTRSKTGKLTPSSKKDVERAESMGVNLLMLSRACFFATRVEKIVNSKDPSHQWSLSELSRAVSSFSEDFNDLEDEIRRIAANEVERFRDNPMFVVQQLVQKRVRDVQACFDESRKAFLYIVDEFEGVPAIGSESGAFPLEVHDGIGELVERGLPMMYVCILYMTGLVNSVSGLVKLIFEAAHPLIPPSWAEASTGLQHVLEENKIRKEARILRSAILGQEPGKGSNGIGDLMYFHELFQNADENQSFAGLKRVTNGSDSVWTSDAGLRKIEETTKDHGVAEAFQSKKAAEAKIAEQRRIIEELEKRLEDLEFRRELNLENPLLD